MYEGSDELRNAARAGAATTAAVLLAVSGAGCGVVGSWSTPAVSTLVVGVDLDLTGHGPGVIYHNGLSLAADLVDEQLADQWRVELRVLDNRGDPTTSAENLATLAADPQVSVVVTAGCPRCVIDAAAELTVPVISLEGWEEVAAPVAERRWVFRLGPSAADNADALSLAMADQGVQTLGLFASSDPYGREGMGSLSDAAAREGLEVVVTADLGGDEDSVAAAAAEMAAWTPPPDPFDQFNPASELAGSGPDAVVLWLPPHLSSAAAAALRDEGYEGQLYLDMASVDELFVTEAGLAGARLVATGTAVADQRIASSPAAAARREWVQTYASRYETYHLHSAFAADALLVVADAVARAGTTDPTQLRTRIESTRIDGLSGPIRFTGDQHSGLSASALIVLTASGDRWQ